MSQQWDAIAALRARAAIVDGWNTTWPVAFAQQPFTVPANRTWIDEQVFGGPGVPVAITPPSTVYARFTGEWRLTFIAPPDAGARATMDMAQNIASSLLAPPLTLADGTALLIRSTDIGVDLPVDGDVRRELAVSYEFTAIVLPTPASLVLNDVASLTLTTA